MVYTADKSKTDTRWAPLRNIAAKKGGHGTPCPYSIDINIFIGQVDGPSGTPVPTVLFFYTPYYDISDENNLENPKPLFLSSFSKTYKKFPSVR